MQSWHIHISGRVQGVGFRPFVYRLAQSFGLKGTVQNGLDGVHIIMNADVEALFDFCHQLKAEAPAVSQISGMNCQQLAWRPFSDFSIIPSETEGQTQLLITPDLAMCDHCRDELHNSQNLRYRYPFITCTHCGPRYSILKSLPFDRVNTSMQSFEMCQECEAEYSNIDYKSPLTPFAKGEDNFLFVPSQTGNRFHAQTNSCQDCGIQLSLHDLSNNASSSVPPQTGIDRTPQLGSSQTANKTNEIIREVADLLLAGKIIAVKGIGGYLLMADATSAETVAELRRRKQRPAKPFALMYPSLKAARQDVEISQEEEEELLSYRAPILLLQLKKQQHLMLALQQVAPNLNKLGIMLPYTPLFELILQSVNRPLITTSANLSGSPIFYQDEEALKNLQGIADYVLANNREICLPQDDSVMQFSKTHQQRIILRRSRGLAPAYRLSNYSSLAEQSCLAMGAQQKSSFALTAHQQLYLSQYLGELSNYHTTEAYRKTLDYFTHLCRAEPEVIIADLHPDYFATQLGQQMAEERKVSVHYVQHHQAHFAAVLAENELLESSEPILGIIWDGTGLGDDRQVWGGEFFTFANRHIKRIAHLSYFPQRFGDKMAREPRLSLLCLAAEHEAFQEILEKKFSPPEWKLYLKLINKPAPVQTSSIGRLFDAVASLLNLCDVSQYESQAAILLEQHAAAYLEKNTLALEDAYHFLTKSGKIEAPIQTMLYDLQDGKSSGEIAARFHLGLVCLVREIASFQKIQNIAFSGGVFQNALLTDLLISHLQSDFQLYFHQQLSPNDESLPLGQIACHWLSQQQAQKSIKSKFLQPATLNL